MSFFSFVLRTNQSSNVVRHPAFMELFDHSDVPVPSPYLIKEKYSRELETEIKDVLKEVSLVFYVCCFEIS